MTELHKNFPAYYLKNVAEWRQWLSENHTQDTSIWLIFYKKGSGTPSMIYEEARDEALCWGWIDSTINKRDKDSYYLRFAKRNPKSNWSRVNKNKITELEAESRLFPSGVAMIEHAKKTGTWDALNDVENLIIPDDLQTEFDKYPKALENFNAFSRSSKRGVLEWLFNAKRESTRQKRIEKIVAKALVNEKIF